MTVMTVKEEAGALRPAWSGAGSGGGAALTPRPVPEGVMPGGAEGALRLPLFQGHPDARASLGCVTAGTLDSPPPSARQHLLPLPGPTPPRQRALLLPSAGLLVRLQVGRLESRLRG